jgi:hypothetical protein
MELSDALQMEDGWYGFIIHNSSGQVRYDYPRHDHVSILPVLGSDQLDIPAGLTRAQTLIAFLAATY